MILSINNREISCPKNDELSNEFIFSETCVFWILCTSVFPFWWHIGFFCCCVVLPSKTQCCRMKNLLHFGIKIILDIFFIFFHNMLNLQNGKFESYFNDENCQKCHKIWLFFEFRKLTNPVALCKSSFNLIHLHGKPQTSCDICSSSGNLLQNQLEISGTRPLQLQC